MSRNKRLILSTVAALAIIVALAGIGYAFYWLTLEVKDNYFHTGTIDVDIEFAPAVEGKVDLYDQDVLYEPGMTVRGDFIVINNSTDENGIWYHLYFSHLSGSLADVMYARIYDGETLLMEGSVRDLASQLQTPLLHMPYQAGGSTHTYTLELHYPEQAGNETQNGTLQYALSISATQRTENPDGRFN